MHFFLEKLANLSLSISIPLPRPPREEAIKKGTRRAIRRLRITSDGRDCSRVSCSREHSAGQ